MKRRGATSMRVTKWRGACRTRVANRRTALHARVRGHWSIRPRGRLGPGQVGHHGALGIGSQHRRREVAALCAAAAPALVLLRRAAVFLHIAIGTKIFTASGCCLLQCPAEVLEVLLLVKVPATNAQEGRADARGAGLGVALVGLGGGFGLVVAQRLDDGERFSNGGDAILVGGTMECEG